jgi:hypothetical protein
MRHVFFLIDTLSAGIGHSLVVREPDQLIRLSTGAPPTPSSRAVRNHRNAVRLAPESVSASHRIPHRSRRNGHRSNENPDNRVKITKGTKGTKKRNGAELFRAAILTKTPARWPHATSLYRVGGRHSPTKLQRKRQNPTPTIRLVGFDCRSRRTREEACSLALVALGTGV